MYVLHFNYVGTMKSSFNKSSTKLVLPTSHVIPIEL